MIVAPFNLATSCGQIEKQGQRGLGGSSPRNVWPHRTIVWSDRTIYGFNGLHSCTQVRIFVFLLVRN